MDTFSMHRGYSVPGVVTGKPLCIGGSEGRPEATGRGCAVAIREAAKHLGISLNGATVAVQGYGNVGSNAAILLQGQGCKIVAAVDMYGGIYNPKGFDAFEAAKRVKGTKSVKGLLNTEPMTNEELFGLECDILVPAALESQITSENARNIKARIVAEGANGPTTPDADKILQEKGVFLIPDILANAGGVVVSYFEWVQDLQCFFWDAEEINRRLDRIMVRSFGEVLQASKTQGTDMRTAAYLLAISRVAEATRVRGIYP